MTDPTMEQEAAEFAQRTVEYIDVYRKATEADDEGAVEEAECDLPGILDITRVIRIQCYTGGPAGGFEFDTDGEGSWNAARAWHQDWFQPKGYVPLDDDTADFLWEHWMLGEDR